MARRGTRLHAILCAAIGTPEKQAEEALKLVIEGLDSATEKRNTSDAEKYADPRTELERRLFRIDKIQDLFTDSFKRITQILSSYSIEDNLNADEESRVAHHLKALKRDIDSHRSLIEEALSYVPGLGIHYCDRIFIEALRHANDSMDPVHKLNRKLLLALTADVIAPS